MISASTPSVLNSLQHSRSAHPLLAPTPGSPATSMMQRVRSSVARAIRAHNFGCCGKWVSVNLRLQSSATSSLSERSGDVKPFDEIPGPGGLPYFGTYFKYKLGKVSLSDHGIKHLIIDLHFISLLVT